MGGKRKTLFGIPYEFYWVRKIKMPVSFPFGKWQWRSVIGIQLGDVFIGYVRGSKIMSPVNNSKEGI